MKAYKDNDQIVIDGENDLSLGYKRDRIYGIWLDTNIKHHTFTNFRFHISKYDNILLRKIWGIWQVIKYF
jgi:hypothetical protein